MSAKLIITGFIHSRLFFCCSSFVFATSSMSSAKKKKTCEKGRIITTCNHAMTIINFRHRRRRHWTVENVRVQRLSVLRHLIYSRSSTHDTTHARSFASSSIREGYGPSNSGKSQFLSTPANVGSVACCLFCVYSNAYCQSGFAVLMAIDMEEDP